MASVAVGTTTKLTATLAIGGLLGFGLASRVLSRGFDPARMASYGAMVGIPAFLCVISAAPADSPALFALGTLLIGFGGGLFGHGTLTATMNHAPAEQRGLALGSWGAVQATAAGLAMALGAVIRDIVAASVATSPPVPGISAAATGYTAVYGIEVALLAITVVTMARLLRPSRAQAPGAAAAHVIAPVPDALAGQK